MTSSLKTFFQQGQVIREPPQATNQLWIGPQQFAHNLNALRSLNIKAVCSLGSQSFAFPPEIQHLYLDIEDSPDEDIASIFDIAYDFIEKHRLQSNVLVHCVLGVSRSASVVCYYLMRRYRWSLERSLKRDASERHGLS